MREQVLYSRRRLVAALPLTAIPLTVLATGEHPDVRLLALGSDLETVHAQRLAFNKAYPEADDDPFYERHWQLRETINQTPAATSAGLAIKARAARMALHQDPGNECEGDGSFRDLSCSLIDDLLRITKKGGLDA